MPAPHLVQLPELLAATAEDLREIRYLARALVAGTPADGYAGGRQLSPGLARYFADCLREAADLAEARQRAFDAEHAGG